MISITDHISYLLISHDCVVVPGLGAFLAQSEPAMVDNSRNLIMPPSRQIGFNGILRHDDGLLTASIARREKISYESAATLVANEVAMIQSRLSSSGFAIIPRLGRLTRSGRSLDYEPADEITGLVNWRFDALTPVSLISQKGVAEQHAADNNQTHILNVEFPTRRRNLKWLKVAASVAVLIGLGFTLSTPIAVDRSSLQYASLTGPKIKGVRTVSLINPEDTTKAETRTLFCLFSNKEDGKSIVSPRPTDITAPDNLFAPKFNHYLIVASCENRRRALTYINRRPGQGLALVEADGRFRVFIAASNTREDVETMRTSELEAHFPGAWIYSR